MRRGRLAIGSTIKVRYGGVASSGANIVGGSNDNRPPAATLLLPPGIKVEVDSRAYMSKLRREVRHLGNELKVTRLAREVRRALLRYI